FFRTTTTTNENTTISTSAERASDRAQLQKSRFKLPTSSARFAHCAPRNRTSLTDWTAINIPVLTLPTELVSEIFIHFLPDYPSSPPLRGTRSPNILAAICQKWRYIALSTPLMWRAILLEDAVDTQGHLRMLETWLSRSGLCPSLYKQRKATAFRAKCSLSSCSTKHDGNTSNYWRGPQTFSQPPSKAPYPCSGR
ncbi:hypothetical protein B0H16DRAFT_1029536, partial [Mycena metata]